MSCGLPFNSRRLNITSEPFERFSLNFTQVFPSVSWCAEPMTQLCKLKVEVTLQGHGILHMAVLQAAVLLCLLPPEKFLNRLRRNTT